ncbi:MAG TPA: hypothetical protein VJB57_15580 [Dehalococcoidia bacterium]|nr:hypothetical protein [Dehalococcoidia bacterium]
MTLLEELQSIDVSGIAGARGSIKVSVQSPQLTAVLEGGAAQAALAGLGSSLGSFKADFSEPEALLRPLLDACEELLGPLKLDGLPLADYVEAVSEGVTIVTSIFESLSGDPEKLNITSLLALANGGAGFSLSGALGDIGALANRYTEVGLEGVGRFKTLLESVDGGLPGDARSLADLAINILLPFEAGPLGQMRAGVNTLLQGSAAIALPSTRTAGLVTALEGVARVAATGDAAALQRELAGLISLRDSTQASIRADLLAFYAAIDRLNIDAVLAPVITASDTLRSGEQGIIEFLEKLRLQVELGRELVEGFDVTKLTVAFEHLATMIEQMLRTQIEAPIEAQVQRLEEWLRNLLRHLPLRMYRAEITSFLQSVADAIREADLDQYPRKVREVLNEIESLVSAGNLQQQVQEALAQAAQVMTNALEDVLHALEQITFEINAVADDAAAVLGRVGSGLKEFNAAVVQMTVAVDELEIETATQQSIDQLEELRKTVETVLSVAPLPEPMRPVIDGLIETLEDFDPSPIFAPINEALAQFSSPEQLEVFGEVTVALDKAAEVVENLIPAELIKSIEAEVDEALDVIRDFDPSTLSAGVPQFLIEMADFIEGLDPRPAAATISGPFQSLLAGVDAVHPFILLKPVIEGYDNLLAKIPTPGNDSLEAASKGMHDTVGKAGESLAQTLSKPVTQLAGSGQTQTSQAGQPQQVTAQPPEIEPVRPGDLIRLFGYLPNKLREAVAALDAGTAGEVLRSIDALVGGLASDLRSLQAALWRMEASLDAGLDGLLAPLGPAQLNAQIAISANFRDGELDVTAAMTMVAEAGPATVRAGLGDDLMRTALQVRSTAGAAGGHAGAALERAAVALERCQIGGLTGDLDAFLKALDPEPLAAELDLLVAAALNRGPEIAAQLDDTLEAAIRRLTNLFNIFNPVMQAQKFFGVLDILREELDLLNPRRLAAELGEIHAAIRETIVGFDPAVMAQEIFEVLASLANTLRTLDPATLLGDLSFLDDILDRVEAVVPTQALANVGASLQSVGAELAELDPAELLASIQGLAPDLSAAFEIAIEAIKQEILALLKSIRYVSEFSASATVSVGT